MKYLIWLDTADIEENQFNPRRKINKAQQEELTESIRSLGIITPIMVRRTGETYTVVAGERRLMAAKEIGLVTVPCLVTEIDQIEAHEVSTAENIVRADMDIADECEAVALAFKNEKDIEAVARKFGRTKRWVRFRSKIADLGENVLEALRTDKITVAHAEMLCTIGKAEVPDMLQLALKMNIVGFRSYIEQQRTELSKATWDLKETYKHMDLGTLRPCSKCVKRTDKVVDLFDDTKATARCMDSKCWEAKRKAYQIAVMERVKASGKEIVPISEVSQAINGWGEYTTSKQTIQDLKDAGERPVIAVMEDGTEVECWKCNIELENEEHERRNAEYKKKRETYNKFIALGSKEITSDIAAGNLSQKILIPYIAEALRDALWDTPLHTLSEENDNKPLTDPVFQFQDVFTALALTVFHGYSETEEAKKFLESFDIDADYLLAQAMKVK